MKSREEIEMLATALVDSAFKVHVALGPGLLESAYQACLAYELRKRGFHVSEEVPYRVTYDGVTLDVGYRADLVLEQEIIVENKVVQSLAPIHEAQLLTYLRLSGLRLGFLINWNVPLIKQGIRRMVHNL